MENHTVLITAERQTSSSVGIIVLYFSHPVGSEHHRQNVEFSFMIDVELLFIFWHL